MSNDDDDEDIVVIKSNGDIEKSNINRKKPSKTPGQDSVIMDWHGEF